MESNDAVRLLKNFIKLTTDTPLVNHIEEAEQALTAVRAMADKVEKLEAERDTKEIKELNMSLDDLWKLMNESNADLMKIVPRDADNKPISAIILVKGDSINDILEAVEAIEECWDSEDE